MAKKRKPAWNEDQIADLLKYINAPYPTFSRFRARALPTPSEDTSNLMEFIAETIGLSFSMTLLMMIDHKGMTDVEVYKAAKIDRRVFSKLRSNDDYQPSWNTAVRLCFGLRTSTLEAITLLEKAGICLSRSKKEDLVVLYCLDNGIYDIDEANEALKALGIAKKI